MRHVLIAAIEFVEVQQLQAVRHKALSQINLLSKKLLGIKSEICIKAEGEQLVFYQRKDETLRSISIESISSTIYMPPHAKTSFVLARKKDIIFELKRERALLRLLRFRYTGPDDKAFIAKSLRNINTHISKVRNLRLDSAVEASTYALNSVHTYRNKTNEDETFGFGNCVAMISPLSGLCKTHHRLENTAESRPRRIIVFYLDNISSETVKKILSNPQEFPLLSKLANKALPISSINSVSNWTFPAGVAMASAQTFEEHKIYHPSFKPYFRINHQLYGAGAKNEGIQTLKTIYQARFVSGNNWRMKQEHGLHSFFNDAISTGKEENSYKTLSNALRHLDIAGHEDSFHWISFMDSHHPLDGDILPYGGLTNITRETMSNGFNYLTGPKTDSPYTKAKEEIYTAQIKTIESHINAILEHSCRSISIDDHAILLVSDHGSSFLGQQSEEALYREKHKIMFSLIPHKSIGQDRASFIEHQTRPSAQCFEILASLCRRTTTNENLRNPNYSQILYPKKPYQFIYIEADCVYIYTSILKLPKRQLSSKSLAKLMGIATRNGKWEKVYASTRVIIEPEQLPRKVYTSFCEASMAWSSP